MAKVHSTVDVDDDVDINGDDDFVDPAEGRRMFDDAVRRAIGISGEEFIRRWEAGEYWGIADEAQHRHIGDLIALIPFARQKS